MQRIDFILFLCLIFLSACKTTSTEDQFHKAIYGYTRDEVKVVTAICNNEVKRAARRSERDRWSKWAICNKQHVMPLDIEMFKVDEREIEVVYDNRIRRLKALETKYDDLSAQDFQRELDRIYHLYGREKAKTGANVCREWKHSKDGSGDKECVDYGKILILIKE